MYPSTSQILTHRHTLLPKQIMSVIESLTMTCKLVSVLTSETEAGSREAAPRPDPEACRQRDRG